MNLITKKNISLDDAIILAKKAIEIAKDMNFNICATVVDSSGVLIASLKDDNANQITPDSSFKKAYTAVAIKNHTLMMANGLEKNQSLSQFSQINENTIVYGGGVPIIIKGELVGALGIAGAPGGNLDDEIATKAIDNFNK